MRALLAAAVLLALGAVVWWAAGGPPPRRDRSEADTHLPPQASAAGSKGGSGGADAAAEGAEGENESDATSAAAKQGAFEASFRLVDPAGRPVAGGSVHVDKWKKPSHASAAAGPDGVVRVRFDRDDRLTARAPGFAPAKIERPDLVDAARGPATVVLQPEYVLGGTIVDAEDRAVAGASVEIRCPGLDDTYAARTGEDGTFRFDQLGPEEVILEVEADGFLPLNDVLPPGDDALRIRLFRGVALEGRVSLEGRGAAAGACVSAGGKKTVADERGRFALEAQPGFLEVYAWRDDPDRRWRGHAVFEIGRNGAEPVDIVLHPLPRSWVPVRLLDAEGAPVANAPIYGNGMGEAARTASDGRVLCAFDLPPGTGTFVAHARPYDWRSIDDPLPGRVHVRTRAAPDGPDVVLRPRSLAAMTVIARGPDGEALPAGVEVRFNVHCDVMDRTDDRITVPYDPLLAGPYVQASAPGYVAAHVQLGAEERVQEIRLRRAGAVRCRVVDRDGVSVLRATVRAWVPGTPSVEAEEAGPDGTYLLEGTGPGDARVTAGRDWDLPLARRIVRVESGRTTDAGTLVLEEPVKVRGRVVDGTGRALGGVLLLGADTNEHDIGRVVTRADGRFEIEVPPWSGGHLIARKRGYGDMPAPLSASGAREITIVLAASGSVRLRVLVPPDHTSPASSLAVGLPGGPRWSPEWRRLPQEDRVYVLRDLPPGPLVIVYQSGGDYETEVVVPQGATAEAEIRVRRRG